MEILLTLLLIGSILSLDLLILIATKYMISMTKWIKDLRDNSKMEYETILQCHTSKTNVGELRTKVKGSNVLYFNTYSKDK